MRRILATDFGIWPAFQNLQLLSDAMVGSPEQWARLANYLLLYDQIVIPTGNFQILPVLRLILGEDVFDELLATKTIVLTRFDKWFGYVGNGGGLVFFQIGKNPDRPNDPATLGVSYFVPLEESIDVALISTNPSSTGARRSKLKNLLLNNVIPLPIDQIEKELPNETYADILNSPYLREFLALRNSGRSIANLKGIGPNQLTIFNPHLPSSNDVPEIRSVLRAGFENFLLRIGGYTEADEVTGDDTTLSILRAKGQRLGFALNGSKAFAQIQEISGVPDLGFAFAHKRMSPTDLLELRSSKHAQALRDWFAQGSPGDAAEDIVRRYVETLGKPSWIDSIPTKILRFAVTTALGTAAPLVGVAASAVDSFLLSKWFPFKSPRLFLKRERFCSKRRARCLTQVPPAKIAINHARAEAEGNSKSAAVPGRRAHSLNSTRQWHDSLQSRREYRIKRVTVCIGAIRCNLLGMLTSQKVIDAINEQIGYEFSAELQYYAIAAHFAAEALPQLSQHFFQQAEEEKGHALRFIKYVVDAGGRVVIPAIDAPKSKFKTARDAVKLSLDQEIHVTQQINGLVGLARKQNDYITINFLQWFLTEQLEEVSSMDNLLKIIERAGNDLLQADEYLARVGLRTMPEPPKQ